MGKHMFYISQGIEVRYFLLSGIINQARKLHDVVLLIDEKNSSGVLKDYIQEYQLDTIELPISELNFKKSKFETYIRILNNSRKRNSKNYIYNHFGGNLNSNKWYDIFTRWNFLSSIIEKILISFLRKSYTNIQLQSFLKNNNVTAIHLLEYNWLYHTVLGVNASLLNISISISINSLKTVFVNDLVYFKFTHLYVWNESQRDLFLVANKLYIDNKINVTGSLYHFFLKQKVDDYDINRLKKKYSIPCNRKLILYSLIYEKVFDEEYYIIEKINNFINQSFIESNRPLIIVRRNPFEESNSHIHKIKNLNNVIVADHFWERDPLRSWSIQSMLGEYEWRVFLRIANISMNITSMSTVDSIVSGTPVLNIAFNKFGKYNDKLDFLINSPFAKEFEKAKFVRTAFTFKSFKSDLLYFLTLKEQHIVVEIQNSLDIAIMDLKNYNL